MISLEQLKLNLNSYEKQYNLLSEKIRRLRMEIILETDPSLKFKVEQDLKVAEGELRTIENKIIDIENSITGLQSEDEQKHDNFFPFTNRESEINKILSLYAPAYYLLDAPAGYGKTALLKQLFGRFQNKQWICAYSTIDTDSTLSSLVLDIASQLDVNEELDLEQPPEILVTTLASKIRNNKREKLCNNGLVLFIDFDKTPKVTILPDLLNLLIPTIQRGLRELNCLHMRHNPFRVILSGRYLAGLQEIRKSNMRLEVLKLTPFDHYVLREASAMYLRDINDVTVNQLAAHLMHYTGGHPGCVVKILDLYNKEGSSLIDFVRLFEDRIYEITIDAAEEVRRDIKDIELRGILDRLSIHHYVDYQVIEHLFDSMCDKHTLIDKLASTYLFDRKGRLLCDDITRRLLTIRLRRTLDPKEYMNYCKVARRICEEHLKTPNLQQPEKWVIENLRQILQQHTFEIQDAVSRKKFRHLFLESALANILTLYVNGRSKKEEWFAFYQEIERDWEFRFSLNYYLRKDIFNDEPYETFLQICKHFFD